MKRDLASSGVAAWMDVEAAAILPERHTGRSRMYLLTVDITVDKSGFRNKLVKGDVL